MPQIATDRSIIIHGREFVVSITEARLREMVQLMGSKISAAYSGEKPLLIGVLNGAFVFLSDLAREIDLECEISFTKLSSYEGLESTGKVREELSLGTDIKNRHVIIVEDIVDTGNTVFYLAEQLKKLHPASVKIATAIFKPEKLEQDIKPDFIGIETGSDFLVGYGMDFDGEGRNLKDIYVLKPQSKHA